MTDMNNDQIYENAASPVVKKHNFTLDISSIHKLSQVFWNNSQS